MPQREETWLSGKKTIREGVIPDQRAIAGDFAACLGSFCQATPKKKLLTWLAANGYEPNLTPQ